MAWLAHGVVFGAALIFCTALTLAVGPTRPLGLDLYVPVPDNNPQTAEKIVLGRRLFHDARLSRTGRISCASCHDPDRSFSSAQPLARGVFGRRTTRNAPALINRAWGRAFFWDGRIQTLEAQVLEPIINPSEMDLTLAEASTRVGLGTEQISQALASYVRSIMAGDSPYDRFLNGSRAALSRDQQLGLQLFRGKGNCTSCLVGPNLTDERLHNTGVAWREGRLQDGGAFAITGNELHRGAFKTPTLRQVARTAPYMHDGSLPTLEAVVEFYSGGGRANPYLDSEIGVLHFTTAEKRALVALLQSLTGIVLEGVGP
jgi:cytochrome c peroxidase